jgi:hypothetical protein
MRVFIGTLSSRHWTAPCFAVSRARLRASKHYPLHHKVSIVSINFGGKPNEPPPLDELGNPAGGPANRRAELWQNMRDVFEEGRFQLPDLDSLQADLVSPGYKYDSAVRLLIESKQDMRKRGMPSPDEADAVALCFSEPGGIGYLPTTNFSRDLRKVYGDSYQ